MQRKFLARLFILTTPAREIWRSGRRELVCITPEGSGLICDEELAAELGVPVLVMLPNAKALVERLE